MSKVGPSQRPAYSSGAPANYVPGLGRGAVGFTTRSDIGPAGSTATAAGTPAVATGALAAAGRGSGTSGMGGFGREKDENEDYGDYSETNYDEFSGYSGGGGLFQDTPYDKDDQEADIIYGAIDERMDSRRKRRREQKIQEDIKKHRQERPKISDQFADLKSNLKNVTDLQWENIPDIGDHSLKNKQKRVTEIFTPLPDNIIAGTQAINQTVNTLDLKQQRYGGFETPLQMVSGFNTILSGSAGNSSLIGPGTGLAEARGAVLSLKLDKMSDSVSGQTVVDPKGYLTSLNSLQLSSNAEISDIKKARLLLKSVTLTNPKHAPGWIAAARLEEVAGKLVEARKIIKKGCVKCQTNEDLWLENARLHNPQEAKTILANAVRLIPESVKIWLYACDLESDVEYKKIVLRKALEYVPSSVKLWKKLIELENDIEDAKIMLYRAVECIPQSLDLWLALARLEDYINAKIVLNKARSNLPNERKVWIHAAKLEETQQQAMKATDNDATTNPDIINRIIQAAIRTLSNNHVIIDRQEWINEAESCEESKNYLTLKYIINNVINVNVEKEDRKQTWINDAENCINKKKYFTAKAIYDYSLTIFSSKKSLWLRTAALLKEYPSVFSQNNISNYECCNLGTLLENAVQNCPKAEILWLMYAKEVWKGGICYDMDTKNNNINVSKARDILEKAFSINKDSTSILLAAVKLEWENNEYKRAQLLLLKARKHLSCEKIYKKSILLELELLENIRNSKSTNKLIDNNEIGDRNLSKENEMDTINKIDDLLNESMKAYPDFPKFYLMACLFYEECYVYSKDEKKSNYIDKARKIIRQGFNRCPDNVHLWVLAARLEEKYNTLNGVTKARSLLEQGRLKNKMNTKSSDVLWLEAIHFEERIVSNNNKNNIIDNTAMNSSSMITNAENLLAKALQECPDSGLLLAESIRLAKKNQKKKISLLALKKKDNCPYVCLSVALLFYIDEKKTIKAKKWFERAVQLDPKFGDAWAYYYKFTLENGLKEEQEETIKRCIAAEPRYGFKWREISKTTKYRRKEIKEILFIVTESLNIL